MAPTINGRAHTFAEHGLYDGLFLMRDEETGTFWDHMTGEAVYGPLVGSKLATANLLHSRVGQVLEAFPDAQVALSDRTWRRGDEGMELDGLLSRADGQLNETFSRTVAEEDDRLPTMDLGMGIWNDENARYYAYERVVAEDNAIVDTFQGRRILIFLDPSAYVLNAFYVDADAAEWDDKKLRLSDGQYVEDGVLHDASGERALAERPLQVFTRWYGFALTFPDAEIYGSER